MKKFLKILIFLIVIAALVFIFCFNKTGDSENSNNPSSVSENKNEKKEEKPDITFTMTAIGDIMCHNTQYWDAYQKETDTYDFSYVFENVKDYIAAGDISIANLMNLQEM